MTVTGDQQWEHPLGVSSVEEPPATSAELVYERAPCDPFCTLGDQCFGCHGWLVMDWFWVAGDDPDSAFGK